MFWATFTLLGGAQEPAESFVASSGDAIVETGLGLCALGAACLFAIARRIRPPMRRTSSLERVRENLATMLCLAVYYRPPPAPSLEHLQILRT